MSKELIAPVLGFHCGIGRRNGIGDYMSRVDAAGLPFALCSVVDGGLIAEACSYTNADHWIGYRPMSDAWGQLLEVPLHDGNASNYIETIESHTARVLSAIEAVPEVVANRERIWIFLLNEVDQDQSAYVASLMLGVATTLNDLGWRVVVTNWATGSQYIEDLDSPEHLALLRYAGANRDKCAIGIHEYSLDDDLLNGYPYLVGRWQFYVDVCEDNDIPEPQFIVKEFGMHENHALPPSEVIPQLRELMQRDRPDIPRMWWGMQPWHGSIIEDTERLVKPITDFVISERFEVTHVPVDGEPVEPEPIESPIEVPTMNRDDYLRQIMRNNPSFVRWIEADPKPAIRREIDDEEMVVQSGEIYATHDGVQYVMGAARTPGSRVDDAEIFAFDASGGYQKEDRLRIPLFPEQSDELSPLPFDAAVLLDVPALSQNDPRWKNERLGKHRTKGEVTIGSWGCLQTACAMLANYWHLDNRNDWTPPVMVTRMREAGAMRGAYLGEMALARAFPQQVRSGGWVSQRTVDVEQRVRELLDAGIPAIVRVDFRPNTPQRADDQHWPVVVGYTAPDFVIIDTWSGKLELVSEHYDIEGSDLLEVLVYEHVPMQPEPAPDVSLEGKPKGVLFSKHRQAKYLPLLSMREDGYQIGYVLSSFGAQADPSFDENCTLLLEAGWLLKPVHYVHPRDSAETQANTYSAQLSKFLWDLEPEVDIEQNLGLNLPLPSLEMVSEFFDRLRARIPSGMALDIYCAQNYDAVSTTETFGCGLHLANWHNVPPHKVMPEAWQKTPSRLMMLQPTDQHRVAGYSANLTLEVWVGGDIEAHSAEFKRNAYRQDTGTPDGEVEKELHSVWLLLCGGVVEGYGEPYAVDVFDADGWKINTERYQVLVEGNDLYILKGEMMLNDIIYSQYEHYRRVQMADGTWMVQQVRDTSPSADATGGEPHYYEVDHRQGGGYCPAEMYDGQLWVEPIGHRVRFHDKTDGRFWAALPSGDDVLNKAHFQVHSSGTFSLGNPDGEMHILLGREGKGRIGWTTPSEFQGQARSAKLSADVPGPYSTIPEIAADPVVPRWFAAESWGTSKEMSVGVNVGRHGELPSPGAQKQLLKEFFNA